MTIFKKVPQLFYIYKIIINNLLLESNKKKIFNNFFYQFLRSFLLNQQFAQLKL